MDIALDSHLSQRLGRIFGLKAGAPELALARTDREQLGAALLRSLEEQPLLSETICTDHWRCRFLGVDASHAAREVSATQRWWTCCTPNLVSDGLDFSKTEHLCTFDGEAGYALGQGQ